MSKVDDLIIQAVDNRIDVVIKERMKFDKTYYGKVINVNKNRCTVNINGSEYICKIRSGLELAIGDVVVIKSPNNNFSFLYVDAKLNGMTNTSKNMKKVCIYYGYPKAIGGSWDIDKACAIYGNYEIVVFGDKYNNPTHEAYEDTKKIFSTLKERYPNTKIVGYVPIGKHPDYIESNLTMEELKRRVDLWVTMGTNGIFLDEFGFDYYVTRERQNEIVSYVKENKNFVFVNSWSIDYIFSSQDMTISWMPDFRPNPNSLPPILDENDYSLFENLFFSCEKIASDVGTSVKLKCSTPWRINDAFLYYNHIKSEYGSTYYEKFKTQMVALDGIPSNIPTDQKNIIKTISLIGSSVLNIPCLAFGDENWGSTGNYHHWGLPSELNLITNEVRVTTKIDKVGDSGNSFPYKYTSIVNGNEFSVILDVPNENHTEWVDGMRWVEINGKPVNNAWATMFEFSDAVDNLETNFNQTKLFVDTKMKELDALIPTLTDSEQKIKELVSQAKKEIDAATSKLDSAMGDLEMLTSGFQYKEREW